MSNGRYITLSVLLVLFVAAVFEKKTEPDLVRYVTVPCAERAGCCTLLAEARLYRVKNTTRWSVYFPLVSEDIASYRIWCDSEPTEYQVLNYFEQWALRNCLAS